MAQRTCSVDECDGEYHSRDMCRRHYEQWRRLRIQRELAEVPCLAAARRWTHETGYRFGCRCEECTAANAARQRAYRKKNPDIVKRSRLKYQFGMEHGEYDRLHADQGGVCAACGDEETAHNQYGLLPLAVDHDHDTGEIRGLLCMRCNIAVGHLRNDPDRAQKVANYLRNRL